MLPRMFDVCNEHLTVSTRLAQLIALKLVERDWLEDSHARELNPKNPKNILHYFSEMARPLVTSLNIFLLPLM